MNSLEEAAFDRDTVGFTPDEGRAWQRGWKACEEAQQAELLDAIVSRLTQAAYYWADEKNGCREVGTARLVCATIEEAYRNAARIARNTLGEAPPVVSPTEEPTR